LVGEAVQAKRKQVDEPVGEDDGSEFTNGSGLLRKKRILTKRRKLKHES